MPRFLPSVVTAALLTAPVAAQTIQLNDAPTQITETDMTLQQAQDAMDPLYLIEAYTVDKDGPRNERGGWGARGSNVYAPGEQIDAVIYLGNVGKQNPGQADNPQEMELFINIRDKDGNLLQQMRPVHTFRGVRRIDTPLQDDYFKDRFTVSARLNAPGRYDVGFVFIDKTRPADKQMELEVPLDVIIEKPDAALRDLTDMMMAGEADPLYSTQRCAAYFHAKTELVGIDNFPQAEREAVDARIRYFLGANAMILIGQGTNQEAAMDDAIAAMRELSFPYATRMKRNYDAGDHPWQSDRMLVRDEAACNVIYEKRERDF
ncbi:hypothetical protein [Yoonia sp. 2307UL14-13]|uniref:hypothetical protein n=1 Tax=Yoonia sp. 2307UL14-13 TaxID=3126506 RepID=UPI00309D91BC